MGLIAEESYWAVRHGSPLSSSGSERHGVKPFALPPLVLVQKTRPVVPCALRRILELATTILGEVPQRSAKGACQDALRCNSERPHQRR